MNGFFVCIWTSEISHFAIKIINQEGEVRPRLWLVARRWLAPHI